jgi:ABC-type nickel/cobalt efflux system permease component RcnA
MDLETSDALLALVSLAALTGFVHTLAGPDHYLPFVMMSRARGWSWLRTALITFLCGLGHVLGSVVLGVVGIAAGIAISRLESVESARGDVAAWLMIAFGLVYTAWGLRRLARGKKHSHVHFHNDGVLHSHRHDHSHEGEHMHVHDESPKARSITPWILFTIFVFGPCEVLIPLLMFPAANESISGLVIVTAVFGFTTIGTMLVMVLALSYGLRFVHFGWLEQHVHTLAGLTIALCGALILLGL